MAHFAEIDEKGNVLRVIVIDNAEMLNDEGLESEELGRIFCANLFGNNPDGWIQTSYNGNMRKNFAGPGMVYNFKKDIFEYPKDTPKTTQANT